MEPRYNDGPTDWRNLLALTRFLFIYFAIDGVTKFVRYNKDFVI